MMSLVFMSIYTHRPRPFQVYKYTSDEKIRKPDQSINGQKRVPMAYTPPPRDPKAPPVRINLLSDTQTRPTPGMREALARADVGDEQIGDYPTVNLLCERLADLLGNQAAVFMPSGTMCNVGATLVHC